MYDGFFLSVCSASSARIIDAFSGAEMLPHSQLDIASIFLVTTTDSELFFCNNKVHVSISEFQKQCNLVFLAAHLHIFKHLFQHDDDLVKKMIENLKKIIK